MSEETGFWTEQEIRDRLSTSTMVFWGFMPVGYQALSELVKHGISKVEVSMSAEQFELTSTESREHMGSILAAFGIDHRCILHYVFSAFSKSKCLLYNDLSLQESPILLVSAKLGLQRTFLRSRCSGTGRRRGTRSRPLPA